MLNTQQARRPPGLPSPPCVPRPAREVHVLPSSHAARARVLPSQLLESVVERPNRSACDMRFLSHIWEAFLRWCAEQFEAKVGIKVLGMGEFCYRKDVIGDMEFLNPMFVVAESFARAFGLHDRRPKTHAVEAESVDLDMSAIASKTTDLLGEVVGREVVDGALQDIIERIGEACSNPDAHGIVTIDFGFAKLFSENKSLEFTFGAGGAKPPGTGLSSKSATGMRGGMLPPLGRAPSTAGSAASGSAAGGGGGGMGLDGSGMLKGRQQQQRGDAPLQRPHRPHMRPVQFCQRFTKDELLTSHAKQLATKELTSSQAREEETLQHLETLQRLRSEMVLDYSQREQRKELSKLLAGHQRVQREEKLDRDFVDRRVYGMDHWPFRTEEQVQEAVAATNAAQKASLDRQVEEKRDRMAFAQREAAKRQAEEQQRAAEELAMLEGQRKGGRAPPMGKGAPPVHSVERALEDAFSRYEEYLHTRKEGLEMHSSFNREQRHLSEQAELLKAEEQRRRTAEMRVYLEKQMQSRATDREKTKLEERFAVSRLPITSLPTGAPRARPRLSPRRAPLAPFRPPPSPTVPHLPPRSHLPQPSPRRALAKRRMQASNASHKLPISLPRASRKPPHKPPTPSTRASHKSLPQVSHTHVTAGSEVDAEEEAYVKMALKHALDGQVERKEASKTNERQQELHQEQEALSHVAREMQEVRFRAYSERKQMEESLRATWAKQQQLKVMEATLQKAEAA